MTRSFTLPVQKMPPLWSPQGWLLRLARYVLSSQPPARGREQPPQAIVERLVRRAALQAAFVGGLAGLGATITEIASIPTFGASLALWVGVSGVELGCLTYMQLRLVRDLAFVYDLALDPKAQPQDILTILGLAHGHRPTELIVASFSQAAEMATAGALQEYVTRQIARLVQRLARNIGWELLERTAIKYAVPIVSIFAGAIINYASLRSLGGITQSYCQQLRLRDAVFQVMAESDTSQQALFPAMALHTARIGGLRRDQYHLYQMLRAVLGDRLQPDNLGLLDAGQPVLDEALQRVKEPHLRRALLDTCILMTLADVQFTASEKQYLEHVSQVLDIPVDMPQIEQTFRDLHPRGISAYLVTVGGWGCLVLSVLASLLLLCWLALFLLYVQAGALFLYGLFILWQR